MVTSESGGLASGPLEVSLILVLKGEMAGDIIRATLRHVDTTVTCYHTEGVLKAVVLKVSTFATNVGDGGYSYFI